MQFRVIGREGLQSCINWVDWVRLRVALDWLGGCP